MQILSLNFYLYSGLWRPIEWSSKCFKILYNMFTCFILYLLIILIPIELLDILVIENKKMDFAMNSLILLSIVSALVKAITIIIHRNELVNLVEKLQKKSCKIYNEEENNIQMKFDRMIRSYSIKYTFLSLFSATGAVLGGMLNILKGKLPFRLRVLYDDMLPLFWFISIQELMSIIVVTIVNVATETMILDFCLQICAQIEILTYRLQRMIVSSEKKETSRISLIDESSETGRLSEHILHHLCIIRLAKMINKIFNKVFFVQFFSSVWVLCTSLYYLSSHVAIIDIISLIIYVFCMFVQIFVYCWAGNEVILKSTGLSAAVYEMDWISMPINKQKDLLMIMKRSTRPIKFTSSFLVTLSLESYDSLLRASLSAFNLLRHS